MVGISQGSFLESPVLIPPLPEQRRIVAVLDTWDQAIDQTERLIAAKMQMYQKQRSTIFADLATSYKLVRLGHILQSAPKVEPANLDGRKLLTVKLHCLGIVENKSQMPRQTRNGRPYYERQAGELIIGRQNFHNGGMGIVPEMLNGFLASNAISSFAILKKRASTNFVYQYLARPSFYVRTSVLMGGTGQKELSETEFLRLRIPLPELGLQEKIGLLLTYELAQLLNYSDALRTQKRGLMQKLLTGEWRLDERFDVDMLTFAAKTMGDAA